MANLEDLGEVISTDVLIIGGGYGGLVAAIKAREHPVDVLIVEKATTGFAGQAPKAGNGIWVIPPWFDPAKFLEYQVRNVGVYLNDQELSYSLASESYGAIELLLEWGAGVGPKDAEGKLLALKHPVGEWFQTGIDIHITRTLLGRARKMGAKILNKVHVVDLLKQDDRVVGAVGFNVIDGRFYIFKAKSTILANGACCYKILRMWHTACGDGIVAAYRAGAEMRNAEFGNYYDLVRTDIGYHAFEGYEHVYNALGENLSKRYVREPQPDICTDLLIGMEREVKEGRGPIYVDMEEMQADSIIGARDWSLWPKYHDMKARWKAKELKYLPPPSKRTEVIPGFIGELAPVKVDHEMKTSLDGLWAIGDTCSGGSAWAGAVTSPPSRIKASALMFVTLSALWAGPPAARFASTAASPKVNYAEVKQLKEAIFAPMQRDKGLLPIDTVYAIQEVVAPIKYNLHRSKDRLEEGLSKIKEAQQRLPELWAKDPHYLGRCHEAKSMAVCAEMTFRSALLRTESRGSHFREDYPERDDQNWLKWIIVKQEAGEMVLSTEPVPIDKYKIKP